MRRNLTERRPNADAVAVDGIEFEPGSGNILRIALPGNVELSSALGLLRGLRLPETAIPDEEIVIALMELISNSRSAQARRGTEVPIVLGLRVDGAELELSVQDRGGGFDPASLPFGLDQPVGAFDPMDPTMVDYRASHGYARSGMGLVIVRKVFASFSLRFVDRLGRPRDWPSRRIVGTKVVLRAPLADGREPAAGSEKRREARDPGYARVYLPEALAWGHVADLSDSGLGVRFVGRLPDRPIDLVRLVISSPDADIAPFDLEMRLAWRSDAPDATKAGFELLAAADPEAKARFGELRDRFRRDSRPEASIFIWRLSRFGRRDRVRPSWLDRALRPRRPAGR
jgi:anti-sigma regulatory factor (Ser/Thr protein kinase)